MAEILLGVTGGIAAYKSLDLLRILQRHGHGVSVVMTHTAERFVGAMSFAALSGREVGTSLFADADQPGYHHLDVDDGMDLMLVAPASANTVAQMAAGMASNLLGSCYLAFRGPVVIAPAMNTAMWLHPATQRNIATLRAAGVHVVDPETGLLADGATGPGRLAEPATIVAAVEAILAASGRSGDLVGRTVLISAGGTREPIDAVRYVGNRSSGRMGWALAAAARDRGADVVVVQANVDLPREAGIRYVDAPTADAMRDACRAEFAATDILIMVAAVADYRPVVVSDGKIDKATADVLTVELERTSDILAELAALRDDQVLIGFAAEHGPGGLQRARDKRERKAVDIVVLNDTSLTGAGFEGLENIITIIGPGASEVALPRLGKRECAEHILDAALPLVRPPAPVTA
ncbi:MAG: bifunctional phosphopantothenoylcysteine decarboxylase/phosphopantothenate--cysteine ligase CoaBC [Thermoleophilia bacterium]|nr:bifunctional phosphopantothenoylcysteine decarboxylase/phosphopantothenate--cysteine ligase CoaBC [Thermoleophilia bacterium]